MLKFWKSRSEESIHQNIKPTEQDQPSEEVSTAPEEVSIPESVPIPPFLCLPNELLLQIVGYLHRADDVNSLLLANRRLATLLTPLLHEYAVLGYPPEMNALHWAAMKGHVSLVKLLLQEGFDVNAAASDGHFRWTPLHFAAPRNDAVFKLLLENGANPNIRDRMGRSPLHCATFFKGAERMGVLIDEVDAQVKERWGSALHAATTVGGDSVSQLLLACERGTTRRESSLVRRILGLLEIGLCRRHRRRRQSPHRVPSAGKLRRSTFLQKLKFYLFGVKQAQRFVSVRFPPLYALLVVRYLLTSSLAYKRVQQ